MKILKWLAIVAVLLLVVGVGVTWIFFDPIVSGAIE